METIKQINKKIENLNIDQNRRVGKTTKSYLEFQIQTLKEVLKLIDKDLKYQKSKLTGNFVNDNSIKWRIIGMKKLKSDIKG